MIRNVLFVCSLTLLVCTSAFSQVTTADTLQVTSVQTAPVVDGLIDGVWGSAAELTVPLGETYDVHNPASITDCAGCHAFNSAVTVKLKAVRTTNRMYVLAKWPDSTASFTRGGAWSFASGAWQKPTPDESEDRIAFFWPIGQINGNPYNTGGCMAKCHMYYPTDTDPHVSTHGIVDDAWLASGRADMWHSKAARGASYLSASGSNLTIDSSTHQVMAGTFSMTGHLDDKYVDVWAPDSVNGEDGGRYPDAGSGGDSNNRIGDGSRPKFMEKAPTDFADAMFLTQQEIDSGECVGNGTTGVSDVDASAYWQAYSGLKAIVPERILKAPTGSRGNLDFGAVWSNGIWTAEIARDLQNGNNDDVQFDPQNNYTFEVALFDNSRHGYEHRTSQRYLLRFGPITGIERDVLALPASYNLKQNFPNPFNPSTMIRFDLPVTSSVSLTVYDALGRIVTRLIHGERMEAGSHAVRFEAATSIPSGVYFYRLDSGSFSAVGKMILLR